MTTPTRWLFLSGVGRSGTTALRTAFGRHPSIVYNGLENNVVQDVLEVAERNRSMPSRRCQMGISEESWLAAFRQLLHSLLWPGAELATSQDVQGGRRVLMAAVNLTPQLVAPLQAVFPGARLVCLIRNGIAVISSRMRYRSFAGNPFEDHCHVWNRSAAMALWAMQHPDQARVFRQEWTGDRAALDAELAGLFSWLGLEPGPEVAETLLTTRFHPTGDSTQPAPRLLQQVPVAMSDQAALEAARRERWLHWTDDQRAVFRRMCGGSMHQLGYIVPDD